MEMRKQVRVKLCGGDVALPVNMNIIEVIERVYNVNINFAVVSLQNPANVKLTQLAEVFLAWMSGGHFEQLGVSRKDVREYVYTADPEQIDQMTGAVMGAALHYRKAISGEDMDTLAEGKSLEVEDAKAKKPLSAPE